MTESFLSYNLKEITLLGTGSSDHGGHMAEVSSNEHGSDPCKTQEQRGGGACGDGQRMRSGRT